jgi:hypothetical protein
MKGQKKKIPNRRKEPDGRWRVRAPQGWRGSSPKDGKRHHDDENPPWKGKARYYPPDQVDVNGSEGEPQEKLPVEKSLNGRQRKWPEQEVPETEDPRQEENPPPINLQRCPREEWKRRRRQLQRPGQEDLKTEEPRQKEDPPPGNFQQHPREEWMTRPLRRRRRQLQRLLPIKYPCPDGESPEGPPKMGEQQLKGRLPERPQCQDSYER